MFRCCDVQKNQEDREDREDQFLLGSEPGTLIYLS